MFKRARCPRSQEKRCFVGHDATFFDRVSTKRVELVPLERDDACAQRPRHTGSRFSANARNPSIWSSLS